MSTSLLILLLIGYTLALLFLIVRYYKTKDKEFIYIIIMYLFLIFGIIKLLCL